MYLAAPRYRYIPQVLVPTTQASQNTSSKCTSIGQLASNSLSTAVSKEKWCHWRPPMDHCGVSNPARPPYAPYRLFSRLVLTLN